MASDAGYDAERVVVLFGSSGPKEGTEAYQQAFELGRGLAEAGVVVANGGYGGTMAAASRGAAEAGGGSIGVTCEAFGRSGPNEWVTWEVSTADLNERLDRLVGLGRAYILLPGGTGTLLELAMVLELVNKRFLPSRPIICMGEFWRPVMAVLEAAEELPTGVVTFCSSYCAVIEKVTSALATN